MSRKRIPRSLPPLSEVLANFSGFSESSNKQALLLLELRKAAKRLRKRKSQPFYPMREIADFFKAPLRTVAIAYKALEGEGLFSRVRSSQTVLIGSADSTQSTVRGVVGIPIWLLSIVVSPFTRAFHMELEDRLSKKGYVPDFIFFRTGEDCHPDFADRLLRHGVNYLIWHTPHPLGAQVQLCMKDNGIRQIIIQSTESPRSQLPPAYMMNWQPAYHQMAITWRDEHISRVLIPKPVYIPSEQALRNFRELLKSYGIQTELVEGNASKLLETIGDRPSTAMAFMDQQGAYSLCNDDPAIIEQIMGISRVAFCRGPIHLPYFQNRPSCADIIGFSAAEMVDRIVKDIGHRSGRTVEPPHCFEALYHPRQPLNARKESL